MAIPNNVQTVHHHGDVLEDIGMSMRAEDFPHIASLLNNLYSDPIAAVLREYSTNAWDSHVEAGVTRPIEVTLPTVDRMELVIQDFGCGMSIDDLRQTYSMYGASSKRHTNSVAGQLGLGSKCGLSYAEAFTITAVKGGVKVVAMSTKDEHGVGVIKILDTVGTDEPNGVRITVPVDRWDIDLFANAAKNLFQFWEPGSVLVDGEAPDLPDWRSTALALDDDTWLIRKDAGLHSSFVIMGNVAYPVDDASLGRFSHRFVARLNIGDVDFVPSREAVHHTRHTDETLSELRDYIAATYKRAVRQSMATAESPWAETMLKVLWMNRTMEIRSKGDRAIWTYSPGTWGNRKATARPRMQMAALAAPSTVVITGYAAKTLPTNARKRLADYFGSIKNPTFVLIPEDVAVGALQGHPHAYAWDEIVGATKAAPAAKAARGPKTETLYGILGDDPMTADQLASVSGQVLYLLPGESAGYGDLGATVVRLFSSAQISRLKRFVPTIEHYHDEVARRHAAAAKAVTKQDRLIVQARTLTSVLKTMNPADVDDPELAESIRLANAPNTATLDQAQRWGVPIPVTDNLTNKYRKAYPLLAQVYGSASSNDLLLYINAKYAQVSEQAAAQLSA